MRRLLLHPGAEVLVGILAFAATFLGIGLSVVALNEKQLVTLPAWIAFGVAALFLALGFVAMGFLIQHVRDVNDCQKRLRQFLEEAYSLRKRAMDEDKPYYSAAKAWGAEVQAWLDEKRPEYSSDFAYETLGRIPQDQLYYNQQKASPMLMEMDNRITNLRAILREVRAQ